ncbi:Predicted Na+-dependent transporter YfeH (YfeH) [Eupransor demetentiae]|uniref:Predicted Na+-dependent transporter YfeH (YfeH) n=2 Tax=Eupransor demetentiae TaxID=3109584 RepID=A0ABM9N3I1_9LACO|nr:Predicted Na+-dependent transporter YfeH (YfeH) [Lactobacillaceae bacterium LMG 33000]
MLKSISSWVSRWFTALIILWAAFNYFAPGFSLSFASNVSYILSLILFGMGLTLSPADFKRIFKRPIPVILGTVAHYVIMPLIAFTLCLVFHLEGDIAAGVILVGSCPSGTASSVMAFLAKGDVALDVSIEALSTLLAPIMLPLLLKLYAGQYVAVSSSTLFWKTLEIVVAPIILGVIVNTFFSKQIEPIKHVMPLISQIAILSIIGVVFAVNRAHLFSAATMIIIPIVMLHNLLGYALGYGFARLIKLDLPQQKAFTFEVGMQDSSLGATLAMKYLVPVAAVPSTFFSIWHNISGSILSSWWARRQ